MMTDSFCLKCKQHYINGVTKCFCGYLDERFDRLEKLIRESGKE